MKILRLIAFVVIALMIASGAFGYGSSQYISSLKTGTQVMTTASAVPFTIESTAGTDWLKISTGGIFAFTQTATTGIGFTLSRDLASGFTNSSLCYIVQDNSGDDQSTLKVKQDGTGDILELFDGASEVFTVADGGAVNATGAVTAASLVCTAAGTFGGGYASTGVSISAAGNIQAAGTLTVDGASTLTGATTIVAQATVAETTTARICTSADYGKLIILTYAGAIGVTLPANGAAAGSYIDFLCTVENGGTLTISPATADTLLTANSADSDAVTFASGHRIAAYCRVISNGSFWTAINLGQTTMGVTDTD